MFIIIIIHIALYAANVCQSTANIIWSLLSPFVYKMANIICICTFNHVGEQHRNTVAYAPNILLYCLLQRPARSPTGQYEVMYLLKDNYIIYKRITNKTIYCRYTFSRYVFIYLNLRKVAQVHYIVKKYRYDISTIYYYECDKY